MSTASLSVNDILRSDDCEYLILYIKNEMVVAIEREITKLSINYLPPNYVRDGLMDGSLKNMGPPTGSVFDIESVPENARIRYNNYKDMVQEVEEAYGPTFIDICGKGSKPIAKKIIDKHKITPKTFWKIIRQYLQSGKDPASLLDSRSKKSKKEITKYHYKTKTGAKGYKEVEQSRVIVDEKIELQFELALNNYKKGRQMTLTGAFQDMKNKYYITQTEVDGVLVWNYLPVEQTPTYRQFYHYVTKYMTKEEKEILKTSKAEVRNNKRLLLSDSMKNIHDPGDMVEIDAMETDVSLVSMLNREQTIGRAILYCMIDVFTRTILAISVSFENNSVKGVTNLLLNLCDDKVEYARKYGIEFDPSLWPSGIIPRRVRADRGAEFRSDRLAEIFKELGIERELVSPKTGAFKGVVEQEFKQMQLNQNSLLENQGLIEKRYDSNHHREATLTINEFTALCINFVLAHNQKALQYFRPNKKMLDAGVEYIPVKLWEYGCKIYGSPRPIPNRELFIWSLLTPASASVSRKGVYFEGHHYLNLADDELSHLMFSLGNKRKKMEIRYDPRDLGSIYYLKNDQLMRMSLAKDKFENEGFEMMGYTDRKEYLKAERISKAKGRRHNEKVNGAERLLNNGIVKNAVSSRYSETSKHERRTFLRERTGQPHQLYSKSFRFFDRRKSKRGKYQSSSADDAGSDCTKSRRHK